MTTTTADKGELLPCPFCGGAPYMTSDGRPHSIRMVGCANCGIQFENYSLEGAKKEWNRRPTNEGQEGLTEDEITALAVEHEIEPSDRLKRSVEFDHPSLIKFARAIERALNQRLAVKEGDGLVGELRKAFPLYNDPREINEDEYPSEWVLLTERKRLHEFLSSHAAPDDQQAKDAARYREALHQISLCSQNSMSGKQECGRIARAALSTTTTKQKGSAES